MSATTSAEQTALTLPQRAAVALGEAANAAKLRELAKQSANIVAVTNADGREEAHRAGMVLRTTRTNITNTGKAAREDATAFSKAVIAMEKDLIALIQPEEDRVLALRDKFDEQLAVEKAAKIAAERARTEAIQARITAIRNLPASVVGKYSAEISQMIYELAGTISQDDAHAATFEEFADEFKAVRTEVLELLAKAEQKQLDVEAAARAADAARIAEAERLAAERAENARVAAENARIAAEQKAEAKRLADLAAEQQAAALALQREAEAKAQAQRDEQAKAAAAQQLAFDKQKAEMDAARRALEAQQAEADARDAAALEAAKADAMRAEAERLREVDHGPALMMNAEFDVARDAARTQEADRLQALTEQAPDDVHVPMPNLDVLLDEAGPEAASFSDDEIIRVVMFQLAMSRDQVIDRLQAIDFDAARAG